MRTATITLAAALMLAPACAHRLEGATNVGISPGATIAIVNQTADTYRVTLVYGGIVHSLGAVPGLETRSFAVPSQSVIGYESFRLVATPRTGNGARESEAFPLSNVTRVMWTLDAASRRSVVLH